MGNSAHPDAFFGFLLYVCLKERSVWNITKVDQKCRNEVEEGWRDLWQRHLPSMRMHFQVSDTLLARVVLPTPWKTIKTIDILSVALAILKQLYSLLGWCISNQACNATGLPVMMKQTGLARRLSLSDPSSLRVSTKLSIWAYRIHAGKYLVNINN